MYPAAFLCPRLPGLLGVKSVWFLEMPQARDRSVFFSAGE